MPDQSKDLTLSPDALASLLAKLDEVLTEAARLRAEVSRQLAYQRSSQQQELSQPSRPKKSSRKRS